tara:strand:- start:3204 stop:4142 length:939 start_codon:yes stop_codon:yes gene_type:complete
MKALVTGGAGFIGSNLVDQLLDLGHRVSVIDNESSDSNGKYFWNSSARNHLNSINDFPAIKNASKGCDVIFHLAAEARIQPSIQNPRLAVKTNVLGTCNVLQAARENGVSRVLYSSTSSAYGLSNPTPQAEEMPNDCLNPYAASKVAGEELCKLYTRLFDLETVIFRYFNVYGNRQPTKGLYATVIGKFIKQAEDGKPMTIIGDGLQRRDYTNVDDVVAINILAAEADSQKVSGETFNVGTGRSYNMHDLVNMFAIKNVGEAPVEGVDFEFIQERLGESRETRANVDKAFDRLGWKPTIDLADWARLTGEGH